MLNREKRLVVLSALLLLSVGWFLFEYTRSYDFSTEIFQSKKVLDGKTDVLSVKLLNITYYQAQFEVEYFYNGSRGPTALIQLQSDVKNENETESSIPLAAARSGTGIATPGRNKMVIVLFRQHGHTLKQHSDTLKVLLSDTHYSLLTEKVFSQHLIWPSMDPFVLNSSEPREIERLYRLCVETIDAFGNFNNVKRGLEQIALAKPDFVPVYAELARYHMKTNWNTEGIAKAEQVLKTALRLDPKHANSLVLLGYVYAHQRRFKEAHQIFNQAQTIGTDNIWLYSNVAELYAMQGKKSQAIASYKKAIAAPETLKTYERARADAYSKLLGILVDGKQWKEVNELHQQRVATFSERICYKSEYADFLLRKTGDYERAIDVGTESLQGCPDNARLVLGMAYYLKWVAVLKSTKNTQDADQYYSRGQALHAPDVRLLYSLAQSEHTAKVLSELKRRGIKIDISDQTGMTALAFSIINGDQKVAQVLIRYGANVNNAMNEEGVTPLMLAASRGDRKLVMLLLKNGANRSARTRSGYTAEAFAKQQGFDEVAKLLTGRAGI